MTTPFSNAENATAACLAFERVSDIASSPMLNNPPISRDINLSSAISLNPTSFAS